MDAIMNVGLSHYLVVSAALFALGLFTVSTRTSAVAILMGVELILNAASLNFVAFSHFVEGGIGGQVFSVFIIVLAAAEAAVALAIVLNVFHLFHSIKPSEADLLRE